MRSRRAWNGSHDPDRCLVTAKRGDAGGLDKIRSATDRVSQQQPNPVRQRRRHEAVTQAPTCHCVGFGEAVDNHRTIA